MIGRMKEAGGQFSIAESRWMDVFRKSAGPRGDWQQMDRMLPPTGERTALELGLHNEAISLLLRERGGTWHTGVAERSALNRQRKLLGERVFDCSNPTPLPFDDETFDLIVLRDLLEWIEADYAFLRECHRVLKPAGSMIAVAERKARGVIPLIRSLLGVGDDVLGRIRSGYTQSEMFDIVKDGFDIQEVRVYRRFMASLVVALEDTGIWNIRCKMVEAGKKEMPDDLEEAQALRALHWKLAPLRAIAPAADALLFFLPGHRIALRLKRRLWIPRKTPTLSDGRSIADAAINTRIGSAAPF
mgnify:CR=1 FL=1